MNLKSTFTLPKLQGEWVLAFGAMNYGIGFWVKTNKFWSWKGGDNKKIAI